MLPVACSRALPGNRKQSLNTGDTAVRDRLWMNRPEADTRSAGEVAAPMLDAEIERRHAEFMRMLTTSLDLVEITATSVERAAVVKYLRGNAESHWNGGVDRIISAMADAIEKGAHCK